MHSLALSSGHHADGARVLSRDSYFNETQSFIEKVWKHIM